MLHRRLALSCLLVVLAPLAAAQPRRANTARIVGEVLDAGPSVAHCGRVHFLVPIRYRVLTSEVDALRASSEIEVIVSCPELSRVRFVVGEQHRLTLSQRRPFRTGAIVPRRPPLAPVPRWWATTVAAR